MLGLLLSYLFIKICRVETGITFDAEGLLVQLSRSIVKDRRSGQNVVMEGYKRRCLRGTSCPNSLLVCAIRAEALANWH